MVLNCIISKECYIKEREFIMTDHYTRQFHELFDRLFELFEQSSLTEIVYERVPIGTAARFARNVGDYDIYESMSTDTLLSIAEAFDVIYGYKRKSESLVVKANTLVKEIHKDVLKVRHKDLMDHSQCGRSTISKFRTLNDGENYIIRNLIDLGNTSRDLQSKGEVEGVH